MVRWLERNGYDVSYIDRRRHRPRAAPSCSSTRSFLSVGHDEYWSGGQRANVEAARDAGVNLAFFSGNEVFWKTRWETSIDGSNTPYRTLVSYKETHANAKIDPLPGRLDRHLARSALQPAGRRRPARERADRHDLHGQRLAADPIDGARGRRQDALLAQHQRRDARRRRRRRRCRPASLGYEWDEDLDNGIRPRA